MITEKDLHEAIAECQGARNPNANTAVKLAAYYTILDHVTPAEPQRIIEPAYSYAPPPAEYTSDSEFGSAIHGKEAKDVMRCIDELMETLRIMQPRLYNAFIRKITAL